MLLVSGLAAGMKVGCGFTGRALGLTAGRVVDTCTTPDFASVALVGRRKPGAELLVAETGGAEGWPEGCSDLGIEMDPWVAGIHCTGAAGTTR
mmetsp:Transcript_21303/g.38932  ORF Transcript_21303/g.38932 Transcript_21303/m.38932 type:complete len:93 (+) Transcript_21303:284-562(+)